MKMHDILAMIGFACFWVAMAFAQRTAGFALALASAFFFGLAWIVATPIKPR